MHNINDVDAVLEVIIIYLSSLKETSDILPSTKLTPFGCLLLALIIYPVYYINFTHQHHNYSKCNLFAAFCDPILAVHTCQVELVFLHVPFSPFQSAFQDSVVLSRQVSRILSDAAMCCKHIDLSISNGLPKGKKADTRPWIDLTNEAQHVETHEVSVQRAEEKNAVDHQDPVSSFIIIFIFTQKAVYVQCSRDVVATLMK